MLKTQNSRRESINAMIERRADMVDRAAAINDKAQRENRELTSAERTELQSLLGVGAVGDVDYEAGEIAELDREILIRRDHEQATMNKTIAELKSGIINIADHVGASPSRSAPATQWRDRDGRAVYVLNKSQKWADLPRERSDFSPEDSIGEIVRAAITGNYRNLSVPVRNAMSTGSNSLGGFLVPDELSAVVIDLARARSVMVQAGAQAVPMESDRLTMAKVASDPAFQVKVENDAFTSRDVTFTAIGFTAHTLGTLITCSRELAEDAPNFAAIVTNAMAAALAAKLDNVGINGFSTSGAGHTLDGLLTLSAPSGTGSVGAIAWEDLNTAVVGVQSANHTPNAYIVSPTINGDLSTLTSGDGSTAAKMWLGPPPNVAPLAPMVTSNCPDTSIIVGDFTKAVYGLRQGALIEVSREAGDAFAKHQVLIKITWRGDFNVFDGTAFHKLTGITT